MKQKIYHGLVKVALSHSVEEVWPKDIEISNQVFLDTRAENEYDVSKIEGARFVGYKDFDLKSVADIDRNAEIIVYCSIGYRSEKIAEKLLSDGFTNVKNLYGGLTEWHNAGLPLVDSLNNATNRVHGYDKIWGQWYKDAEVVYDK
ncbi:MAG: rhodanese-like domain-containing protein [Reichenbachiella sp.]